MEGLQRQAISVNLAQGLDTKTDAKHVVPGRLVRLENGVYRKNNRIDKRPGHEELTNVDITGTTLGTGAAVESFNDELLQYNAQRLYAYSEGANAWIDKGASVSAIVESKQVIKNTAAQTQADCAIHDGIGLYAWEDSRGGVRACVIDESTGSLLLADTSLDASASRVKCLAFANYLFVFYYKSGTLYVRRINPLSPTSFDSAVSVSTTVNTTNPHYDVSNYRDQRIMFAHNVQGASQIKVGWLNVTPAVQTGALAPVTIAEAASGCITIVQGPTSTFYLGYYDGSNVRCIILNNGAVTLYSAFTLETIANIRNITGYVVNAEDGVQFMYEYDAASDYNHYIKQCKANSGGTAGTPSVFMRSVGLFSKAFSYTDTDGNRTSYVCVAHGSTLQSTYFVIRSDGLIVGKMQYTNGGGITTRSLLATVNTPSPSDFVWSILKKNQIVSENATIFTPLGVMRTSIDFENSNVFLAKQLGNNLLIVGGTLSMYDGQSVVEHGFHLYPENVVCTAVGSGGSLDAGSYQIYVVYEWTDNFGQIHRSQPSVASTVSTGASDSITVVVPSLRLTRKDGTNRTNVSIVGYVTEKNGSIAYRYTSVSSPTYNDTTADTVSLPTITSVANITSNEILYTTGEVLPNYPAPACAVIEVFKNRVFLGGLEEPNYIVFSKENKQGAPVEFAYDFRKAIESARGRVRAFGVIDDKLIITKVDKFYTLYGDGPNDTDTLGGFSEIEAATVDVGCDNARSIASLSNGIILKTKKGFYGIDATLNPVYIGADVEDYNSLSVTSATLLADLNEVRFTTSDGDMLIYNYYFQRWSTATGLKASDGVLWGNTYVVLKTDGRILLQSDGLYKDGANAYKLLLQSGWLSLSGITSFKRIYELMIIGDYKSSHKLRVSVGYDYSSAWEHSGVYDPDFSFPVSTYGDDTPYGETGTVYGGPSNAYMVRVHMKKQKCAAFRFKIEELVTTATSGTHESLTISDIGILIGQKAGQAKVGKNRIMGLS